MYSSLYFQIAALFFLVLLFFSFFGKERVNNAETKVFTVLLFLNLFGVIVDVTSILMPSHDNYYFFKILVAKLYLIYLLSFYGIFLIYAILPFLLENMKTLKLKLISLISYYLLNAFIILLLPLELYAADGVSYSHGSAVIYLGINAITLSIIMIITVIITGFKKQRNKAIISLIVFGAFSTVLQLYIPQLLISTIVSIFISYILYLTMENPDVKLINKLKFANTQVEKSNRAKTDFLSSMSHEIRTPLNAIVNLSKSIKDEGDIAIIKEDAEDIINASETLMEIVNGILDISKIEANKMEVINVKYDLEDEINNLVKLLKTRIGNKPLMFNYVFNDNVPHILNGDVMKVKQIVTNLVTNAIKYTDEGFVELEISSTNEGNFTNLVFAVSDTGRGIQQDKINTLFTKFDRLDEDKNSAIEGTGLGLAITKSLVDLLGGKIEVTSTYGSGSKFIVYLKQEMLNQDEKLVHSDDKKEVSFNNYKILVVDDNRLNIRVSEKMLSKYEIVPDSVESGFECLEKVKNNKYDLILLDDMMPKLSGKETLLKLKENSEFKTPVVVLTANALSGMKEQYLEFGFDDYLPKPIVREELDKILRKFYNK